MIPFTEQLFAAQTLLLLTSTFCLANTNSLADNIPSAFQSLQELSYSDPSPHPVLHLKLDRRELAPSHLEARSIRKPYTV
ncbi:hypothetical protein BGX24_006406, partial [Mortierella sp. AD032]